VTIDQLVAMPGSTLAGLDGRLTIVLVADGFKGEEIQTFRAAAAAVDQRIRTTAPYDGYRDLLNLVRLETDSTQSGTELAAVCPPAPSATRFKATFCASDNLERALLGDGAEVVRAIESFPPLRGRRYLPFVLLNSELNGGMTSGFDIVRQDGSRTNVKVAWITIQDGLSIIHELSHPLLGVLDEYENNGERVDPGGGSENLGPNVTSFSTAAQLATSESAIHRGWAAMIRPETPTPSTKPKLSDEPRKTSLAEEPLQDGVSVDDIGLFEGADHRTKGRFRAKFNCLMRSPSDALCPVCQLAGRARLSDWQLPNPSSIGPVAVGPATHLTMLAAPDRTFIVNYDAATGAFEARQAAQLIFRGDRDSWAISGATLGAGWTALTGFATGLRRFVLTHDAVAARTAVFRLDAGTKGSVALLPAIDTGVGTGDQWTSVSVATVDGTPHMLGYNSATGVAALFRIDAEATTPGLAEVASWRTPDRVWQTGWNHVVTFSERGVALVLRSGLSGARDLNPLLPRGTRPRDFTTGDPVQAPGFTHVLPYEFDGFSGLLRYSAFSGVAAFEQLRPSLTAFEAVGERRLAPGALTVLGTGAPVFAAGNVAQGDQLLPVLTYHHAPSGTLQTFTFSRSN
jgi:IgA Peptidase M64